ncbi:putative Phosphoglucosamine mutase [Nitrospina gracilis 3/211]|uniref:Putative Phosphoglucosamine mutase n=1 Tax=Nitrospina gracilis (strain 3/211) TaxID=1266370 RepID=M1Z907_NITG3|nr:MULTISPECIES: ManB family protein [Nitrospina]MCF8722655.1 phosphomannomutase [Nitrospina sp. Nb-3]CCQ89590.1 putative Phosphoglucosamine mutase [Nitrospina gracilis 3/211]
MNTRTLTMPKPSTTTHNTFRIQGTDGIRREVMLSSHPSMKELTPQEAFLKKGVITDLFMEQYAYAHVQTVLKERSSPTRPVFAVAWDPRDIEGKFNEAVVRGIRKAGADAHVLGIAPTPLAPLYVQFANADGGFMVTASHNPKDQNGIKIFLAHRGMKLLPENDVALTRALMDTPSLVNKPLKGKRIDRHDAATNLFLRFSLDPENSWVDDPARFKNITLVVDPACGALTGIAAAVFRRAGFGKVIEVNTHMDGHVNVNSGVADLEGHRTISPQAIAARSGAFRKHRAVVKLFQLGRKHRTEIQNGKRRVTAAVFDADGDRFYRLDYDPFHDQLTVSSGDETAYLQAAYLLAKHPDRYRNAAYIHTVESDLNTGIAAGKLGLKRQLSAVGDKWILYRIAMMAAHTRIQSLPAKQKAPLQKKLKALQADGRFDVAQFEALEKEIDRVSSGTPSDISLPFAVGSEETGHNITLGWLDTQVGGRVPVFCGNGLKSALNTFAATESLMQNKPAKRYYSVLAKPFAPGFKATLYSYYVRQPGFHHNSPVWKQVLAAIRKQAKQLGFTCKTVHFEEDPDMLYVAMTSADGREAAVFVRNSGTENKIGVNLRGAKPSAKALNTVGEATLRLLMQSLKDSVHPLYAVEQDLLQRMVTKPLAAPKANEDSVQRVLREMGKQGLTRLTPKGFVLTPRGKWYIEG